ncbi:MAG: hypothetical protein U1F43_08145 [Myxococcota bacterium]
MVRAGVERAAQDEHRVRGVVDRGRAHDELAGDVERHAVEQRRRDGLAQVEHREARGRAHAEAHHRVRRGALDRGVEGEARVDAQDVDGDRRPAALVERGRREARVTAGPLGRRLAQGRRRLGIDGIDGVHGVGLVDAAVAGRADGGQSNEEPALHAGIIASHEPLV